MPSAPTPILAPARRLRRWLAEAWHALAAPPPRPVLRPVPVRVARPRTGSVRPL